MLSLKEINIETSLDTSTHDLSKEFFIPLLSQSVRYDRGVGYFSSGWLQENAEGLNEFASNGGRVRWIIGPDLTLKDWEAIQKGDEARVDEVLKQALIRDVENIEVSLKKDLQNTLAWLVADGVLEFKIAVLRSGGFGQFHPKFGVFYDEVGNYVAFNGSNNESRNGTKNNFESLDVFPSWEPFILSYAETHKNRFTRLWENKDKMTRVLNIGRAATERIIRLQNSERPYPKPKWLESQTSDFLGRRRKSLKDITLWRHQEQAIKAWKDNNSIGILNMATGSGKTITSIIAAKRKVGLKLLLIAVPKNNLVDQWNEEVAKITDFDDPILIYELSKTWQDRLFNKLRASSLEGWRKPVVLIGGLKSLCSPRFQTTIEDCGIPDSSMIIVDEVHNIGATSYQVIMNSKFQWRLGLSATPGRSHDEEGTTAIFNYFDKIVFEYGMKEALDEGRLTPYFYHVYPAELTEDEYGRFISLTQRIISSRSKSLETEVSLLTNNTLDGDGQDVSMLLFQRAKLLKKASNKFNVIKQILEDFPPQRCLIYCADIEQMEDVQNVLNEKNIGYLKYIGGTPKKDRFTALNGLADGHVPILLAIDCLDEGVDVPAVDSAIILASSTNDRQFIQRRGRVLRKSEGKKRANLIDVIVVPPKSVGSEGKWVLKGELARAKKMAELAANHPKPLLDIKEFAEQYGVLLTELL